VPILERIEPQEALSRLQNALGSEISNSELNLDHLSVTCAPENLVEVVRRLRDGDGLGFTFFTFLSAIDRSEFPVEEGAEKLALELLVHLYSPDRALHVTVRVPLPMMDPECPSISGVFRGAIWHERECHEMFGIDFKGHPKLVGLYLPEDFEGHPLLKAFKLPGRALVKEWPGAKDPDEAAAGGR
jgi:NADH:ubiquinone oxidoreductase subunit C